ncbi:helicase-related protein [Virgibacillus halodenitrificans]|uniref:helicase-related protein n=1 Tax=Virgibacillus halodenitrificans TaxID=1482 RepID=UPI000EF4E5BA|nr:helicase-related protein [Virgibacillus halodenitrificans]
MYNHKLEEVRAILNNGIENEETPKMIQVFVAGKSYQQAFCFALALEERGAREPVMLATIIAGADSTIQSIKATIDTGTYGLSFGYGKKDLASYRFFSEQQFFTDKGKYNTFPMTVGSRKALAIIHDEVLDGIYNMSFTDNPAHDIRKVLGGKGYGIPLLDEWSEPVYQQLKENNYVMDMPVYYDKGIFPEGFCITRFDFSEEQADELVSELIKEKRIQFPVEGTGETVEKIEELTGYMDAFNQPLIDKLSNEVEPSYDPMTDKPSPFFEDYNMKLFPVQAHVSTGIAQRLAEQKAVILQGEMSTGKSKMMTAIADAYLRNKGKKGYHVILMVPPSLTDKWSTEEIYDLLPEPHSEVIMVRNSADLIRYHQDWIKKGRPEPEVPTFFVVSFTTMRSGMAIEPVVDFHYINTKKQKETSDARPYRFGYICPDCGKAHQVTESTNMEVNESGEEVERVEKRIMLEDEFGRGRRLHNSNKPANAFCSECGSSLWTHTAPTRYLNFKDWVNNLEKPLTAAIEAGDRVGVTRILKDQREIPKKVGKPRRVSTIEYIRRKMKNFFDVCIIDEVHELKGGATAQGNALGSLVGASKKCIAGTGTLFGGKAEDIYYLMWRLFPYEMVKAGFKFSEVTKWNEEYGNIERTSYSSGNDSETEYTNKQSRGGQNKTTEKVKPGISPFVFGRFLVQNTCLVRLLDVWPDPVELVDVPTIFVEMNETMKDAYEKMKETFDVEIEANRFRKDGKIPNLWLLYTETGISYLDNPMKYPDVWGKQRDGERKLLWEPTRLPEEELLPKEEKLIEIVRGEASENRPSIIYVRDTGSTNKDRDIQPRLQKVIEENVDGAKVAILRTNTTATDQRSKWLRNKIENEGVNVVICSMELVKVGLDLIKSPTLIFYQFSWSMFTLNQAARRAWRIGQNKECRLYYLAYKESFQEYMATLIAQKNRASQAINGTVSSDGLNAMLGDDGDLQSMLIKSVKEGGVTLKGSTEEWIATTTDRAREILQGIGKKKAPSESGAIAQLLDWARQKKVEESSLDMIHQNKESIYKNIMNGEISGFRVRNGELFVDEILAFGFGFEFLLDADLISHLLGQKSKTVDFENLDIHIVETKPSGKRRNKVIDGQLAIDLFSDYT